MGLDTKALRERNQLLSSGAALDACEAADEIDSLRAQLAEAGRVSESRFNKPLGTDIVSHQATELAATKLKLERLQSFLTRKNTPEEDAEEARIEAEHDAKVRAAAMVEAAKMVAKRCWCLKIRNAHVLADDIEALAPLSPGFRVVEEEVIHSILGHIEASMQHTHGVDCRGFDDGDDINSDGDCGCGLVSASKARAALAALEDGKEKHGT